MKKNDSIEPACSLCEHAKFLYQEELLLCDKKGVVFAGYRCRRFSLDLLKLSVSPRKNLSTSSTDTDFSL